LYVTVARDPTMSRTFGAQFERFHSMWLSLIPLHGGGADLLTRSHGSNTQQHHRQRDRKLPRQDVVGNTFNGIQTMLTTKDDSAGVLR
jgi:hypothetical protein